MTLRTKLGGGLTALAVVALVGAGLGITLNLWSHSHVSKVSSRLPLTPTKPPVKSATSPTPLTTPSTLSYLAPSSISFPTPSDGWAIGDACDSQRRCEVGAARSTDGGATWALVSAPVSQESTVNVSVAAASSVDAWVWGSDSSGRATFASTHNGGQSWDRVGLSGGVVLDMAIANGTAWAEIGCASGFPSCTARLLSSPVHGGPWSDLGPLPAAMQGAPFSNSAVSGPKIVRSLQRAWVLNANLQQPGLVRSDDGGRSWVTLPLPCAYGASMILGASSAVHVMLACAHFGGWPAPQEVWSSSDGGAHWILRSREWFAQQSPPQSDVGTINNGGAPIGLVVLNNSTAWMANDREDNLVTHDDGVSWTHAALPQNYFGGGGGAEGLVFADALHGWTFVPAGMWATSDGGANWRYQPVIGPVPGTPAPTSHITLSGAVVGDLMDITSTCGLHERVNNGHAFDSPYVQAVGMLNGRTVRVVVYDPASFGSFERAAHVFVSYSPNSASQTGWDTQSSTGISGFNLSTGARMDSNLQSSYPQLSSVSPPPSPVTVSGVIAC